MTPYVALALAAIFFPQLSRLLGHRFNTFSSKVAELNEQANTQGVKFINFAVLCILILFSGLRATSVGTDTVVYSYSFDILDSSSGWLNVVENQPYEVGYTLLMLVVKSLGGSFQTLLLVTSTFTVSAVFIALRRRSKDIFLATGLYVLFAAYLAPMNLTRQGLAVALIFLASTFLSERLKASSFIVFTLLAILATSFHGSALLAAVALIGFSYFKISTSRTLWVILFSATIAGSLWASDWLERLISLLSPQYQIYLEAESGGGVGIYLSLAITVTLLLYSLITGPAKDDLIWANFLLLSCMITIIGTQSIYAARLGSYFSIFIILLLPNVMRSAQVSSLHRVLLYLLGTGYYITYLLNYGGLTPYQFLSTAN